MEKQELERIIRGRGFSGREFASLCGIDFHLFRSRLNGESEFTLEEIEAIIDCLALGKDEVMLIFFGK